MMLSDSSVIFGFRLPTMYWTRSTPYWCSELLLFTFRFATLGRWFWIRFDLSNDDLARFLIISILLSLNSFCLEQIRSAADVRSIFGSSCESPYEIVSLSNEVCFSRLQKLSHSLKQSTTFLKVCLFVRLASAGDVHHSTAAMSRKFKTVWNFFAKTYRLDLVDTICLEDRVDGAIRQICRVDHSQNPPETVQFQSKHSQRTKPTGSVEGWRAINAHVAD